MGGVDKLLVITDNDYTHKEKDKKIKRIFFTFIVQLVSAKDKNLEFVLQFKSFEFFFGIQNQQLKSAKC